MNSNSININVNDLDTLINKLEINFNNINNCFSELERKMNSVSIGNNDVWDSPAQNEMYEYYENIKKLFPLYANKFSSYILFLRNISSNYKINEKNSLNVLETNQENLNIAGGE